jgi:hypothetical protein
MVRDENPDANAEASGRRRPATITSSTAMAFNLLSRRICEHMYQTHSGVIATSSLIAGVAAPAPSNNLLA